eukprot:COSAG05_NODE_8160_length_730_cov_1.129952_2_plen_113_part_01
MAEAVAAAIAAACVGSDDTGDTCVDGAGASVCDTRGGTTLRSRTQARPLARPELPRPAEPVVFPVVVEVGGNAMVLLAVAARLVWTANGGLRTSAERFAASAVRLGSFASAAF